MKKALIKASIIFVVGAGFSLLIASLLGAFKAETLSDTYKSLCDGFFAPAVIIFSAGMLTFCSNGGSFDMLSYGTKKFLSSMFMRRSKLEERTKYTFADYREERMQNPREFVSLLISGGALLIVALIFFALYSKVTA